MRSIQKQTKIPKTDPKKQFNAEYIKRCLFHKRIRFLSFGYLYNSNVKRIRTAGRICFIGRNNDDWISLFYNSSFLRFFQRLSSNFVRGTLFFSADCSYTPIKRQSTAYLSEVTTAITGQLGRYPAIVRAAFPVLLSTIIAFAPICMAALFALIQMVFRKRGIIYLRHADNFLFCQIFLIGFCFSANRSQCLNAFYRILAGSRFTRQQ